MTETPARFVKAHPSFRAASVSRITGRKTVSLKDRRWHHFFGHSWSEAFKKAAAHIVTTRITS